MVILRENKSKIIKNIGPNGHIGRHGFKGRYGLAVDIGTTTVAAGLFDLSDGRCIDVLSEKNRQCSLGSDIIMRMMHACNGKLNELHEMIVSQIENMAGKLCRTVCKKEDICKMSIVGNTAMCHIFLGKDVSGLARSPFSVSYRGSVSCTGRECGFEIFPDIEIYVMSGVAAHVGADALSVFCAGCVDRKDKNILAIDIGTNAEIMLGCGGVGYACSAAAGPAFEGREVSCGMPAGDGAISGVKISRGSGNIILDVITEDGGKNTEKRNTETGAGDIEPGNTEKRNFVSGYKKNDFMAVAPKGICGSGLIDLIAELRKHGFINGAGYLSGRADIENTGLYKKFCENIVDRNGEHCFALCGWDGISKEIYISQSDIRNFQLAKAAIQAGANCLLLEAGVGLGDLDEVVIAGMFGSHLPVNSAVSLGLFPDMAHEKIKQSGNLAGTGVAKALFSEEFRKESEGQAAQIRHIELADKREFERGFVDAMELKPWV